MTPGSGELYVALLHWPVRDRRGQRIASAVTHLDVHDIARTARTYGGAAFFVVQPVAAQRELVEHIVAQWTTPGAGPASPRAEALRRVRVVPDLGSATDSIAVACQQPPFVVATSASARPGGVEVGSLRARASGQPLLLVFGTGWGLCDDVFEQADATLRPIDVGTGYNHLPVRAAVAIVLDRLLAQGGRP